MYQCGPRIQKSLLLRVFLTSCNLTTCYNFFLIPVISVDVIANENYRTFQPSDIYLLKFNNKNTQTRCEICSKLTIKMPERHQLTSLRFLCCKVYTHFTTCLVFVLLEHATICWTAVFLS